MKRILVVGVISLFVLFIFAGGALAAKKKVSAVLPMVGAEPAEFMGPSPIGYEGVSNCEAIDPDPELTILQHDVFGTTWYEYQKNGSMGRMIAVSNGPYGYRSGIWHRTDGPYGTAFPRYVDINCKDTTDHVAPYCGPSPLDGGTGINAGYAQAFFMTDGSEKEVFLYHRTAPPIGCWYTTLAIGEAGFPCDCYVQKLYDLPDFHDAAITTTDPNGNWPKGALVYDADKDSNYIHVISTENNPLLGGDQSIAYQRCVFEGDPYDVVCYSLHAGQGPYRRAAGGGGSSETDPIAVFDTTKDISAVVVSSPVSKKVAIVYTKHREDSQINCDVVYCESPDNGDSWFAAHDITPCVNITNYDPLDPERAYTDVAACYDYNDSLHIVWQGEWCDSAGIGGGFNTSWAKLKHWSKKDGISTIASAPWLDTSPGGWNRNMSKMSVSAKDPIYHDGGDPDSVFLFVTWTQFNEGDESQGGYSNGDLYVAVSNNGGDTWTPGFRLTHTETPDCAPGECLSEHWSSLAENLHGGDLHIQYICDRDAGGAVQNEGAWVEGDVMYMHVEQPPVNVHCGLATTLVDPADFCTPPLKIAPGTYRVVTLKLEALYNRSGDYEVTCADPRVLISANPSGTLNPGDTARVDATVTCPANEDFIAAKIVVNGCIGLGADETSDTIALHAVCSNDYYECYRDPRTQILKDNGVCSLWVCCNTEQRVWDKRLVDTDENTIQPIFSSGVIVATSDGGDVVVGRQDYSDTRTGTRDTIRHWMYPDKYQPECLVQKIHCEKTFICANNLEPPKHLKWWWVTINKQIIMYHDNPGFTCPEWKKEQIIKYIWVKYADVPGWWPDQSPYTANEDMYVGVFADVDAPFDTGCNGCNKAGYDNTREIMWQRGYNADIHPEYEQYYVGLALTNTLGSVVAPVGAQNVLNEEYIYPQDGWGWVEDSLYKLASTPGVHIHYPDSMDDRTMVLTAGVIPAGTNPDAIDLDFILIEAFIPYDSLAMLTHIDDTRATLIPELDLQCAFDRTFPPRVPLLCGDANLNGTVDLADAGYIITWLFLGGPPTYYGWPFSPGDANGNGTVDLADAGFIITWLFLGGPAPAGCQPICP